MTYFNSQPTLSNAGSLERLKDALNYRSDDSIQLKAKCDAILAKVKDWNEHMEAVQRQIDREEQPFIPTAMKGVKYEPIK